MPDCPEITQPSRLTLSPLKITAIYAIFGGLWILLSDKLLALLVTSPRLLARYQTYKSWSYVALTALLLYGLIRWYADELRRRDESLKATARKSDEEKSRREAIIAAMGDGVSIQDEHFRILFQNKSHRDLMGDHVGEVCFEAYGRCDSVCDECPLALSYRDGGIHSVERSMTTVNGPVQVEIIASSVHDATGRTVAGIEMVRNITDRKENEAALRVSEKKYRDLVDNALVGVYRTTIAGRFLYVNDALAHMLGYDSPQHMLSAGNVAEHYIDPVQRVEFLRAVRKTGSVKDFELELRTRSGSIKNVLVSESFDNDVMSGMILDITERKRAEDFVKDVLEAVDEAFIVIDRDYRVLMANRAYCAQAGLDVDAIIGRHCYEISHQRQKPCYEVGEECTVRETFETGRSHIAVHTHHDSHREAVYVETKSYAMRDKTGTVVSAIEIIHNITDKRKLEEQLNQAQKMEAVGTLTGGIAHDFNNILTAVLGYATILKKKLKGDEGLAAITDHIASAAKRGANLTRSLLAFSRKQSITPGPVDLNEIVTGIEKLLLRVIGEDVELVVTLASGGLTVMADRGQVEQVLMNLCSNGRDAMPSGGILSIATERGDVDENAAQRRQAAKPGAYAVLSVADTGTGMDAQTQEKIFDPFFTTKEVGKGTGLGLSIVYGIVKQHGGFIDVKSRPGDGTTFKVYLPLVPTPVGAMKPEATPAPMRGSETILLAEDGADVRAMAKNTLEEAGYTVIEAIDGDDALRQYAAHKDNISLLVLDVIMPKKNAREVYDEIVKTAPGIKVLFISGYTGDIIDSKRIADDGPNFLPKPFLPDDLVRAVRAVLDNTHTMPLETNARHLHDI